MAADASVTEKAPEGITGPIEGRVGEGPHRSITCT